MKSWSMFQNIYKLPLTTYIDIITTNDLKLLVISGNPTNEEIEAHWSKLQDEYIEAIGGDEIKSKLEDTCDKMIMQSRVVRARALITIIASIPSEALFKMLYEFDYPLPYYEYSEDNLEKVLKIFIAHYKLSFVNLQSIFSKQENVSNEDLELDYKYFMTTIVDMNNTMKINLNINELSLGEYCINVARYREYCIKLQTAHGNS